MYLTACSNSVSFHLSSILISIVYKYYIVHIICYFFGGGRGLYPGPCIYYVLSLPTELSLRGHTLYVI